jgi:ligand-binding SRPBCC domain-containing protein
MPSYRLHREQWFLRPIEDVFDFFSRPENLEEITPPFLRFQIVSAERELHPGSRIEYRLRVRGLPMRWVSEISEWDPPRKFADTQLRGPYAMWRHQHIFVPENGGTRIIDDVEYALPFGMIGRLVHALVVRRDVERIFDFRQRRLEELLGKSELTRT